MSGAKADSTKHDLTLPSGLLLAIPFAGGLIGALDVIDTALGGFAGGLGIFDLVVVTAVSSASGALIGALTALAGVFGVALAAKIGVDWDPGGLGIGRRRLPRHHAKAVATASLVGLVAFAIGSFFWLLLGPARGSAKATALAMAGGAMLAALSWFLLSRPGRGPRARTFCVFAVVIVLYVFETRLIYMFSRIGTPGTIHAAFLPILAATSGFVLWRLTSRTRASALFAARSSRVTIRLALLD